MAASEPPLISGISSYIMFGICWIFTSPDSTRSQQYLNVTAVAAASKNEESHPWPVSKSVSCASGSLATSAILECLLNE